jgi:hypothetical protein
MIGKFWESVADELAKRWVRAVLLPAAFFWLAGIGAWLLQADKHLDRLDHFLTTLTSFEQVALAVGVAVVVALSGVLADRLQVRLSRGLEGFWWRRFGVSWLADQRRRRFSRTRDKLSAEYQGLLRAGAGSGRSADQFVQRVNVEAQLRRIPLDAQRLAPTKLGNILRAGEARIAGHLGLDPGLTWSSFWLCLPQQARDELSAAHRRMDSPARGVLWSALLVCWTPFVWWAPVVALAGAVAFYGATLSPAETFADLLEAAYKICRFDLYVALHWELPINATEERQFADELNVWLGRGYDPSTDWFHR